MALKLFDALAVGAVRRVDADLVALVDEERNHDDGAGFQRSFLERVGRGGVAFDGTGPGSAVNRNPSSRGSNSLCTEAILLPP